MIPSDYKKFLEEYGPLLGKMMLDHGPEYLVEFFRRYFRLQVEGQEHLQSGKRGIIAANHSGFSGFDGVMLAFEIKKWSGEMPCVLTHKLWFSTEISKKFFEHYSFIEATTTNGLKALEEEKKMLIFPEGEFGNFKPSSRAYELQRFKRGFVRMALKTQSPIIPALIIGAEETHINLRRIRFKSILNGAVFPLPLNLFPLPARWKIKFLPPIELPYKPESANNVDLVHEITEELQETMQLTLNQQVQNRDSIYL